MRLYCLLAHPFLGLLLSKFHGFGGRFAIDTDIAVKCE